MPKIIKVLLAKVGLDPHDKGVKLVARGLRDVGGMEVIYTGLYRNLDELVQEALENMVDIVGVSVHTGLQMNIFPNLRNKLNEIGGGNIILIGGGVMPVQDITALKANGTVAEIFGPSTSINTIIDWINQVISVNNADRFIDKRREKDMESLAKLLPEEEMKEKVRQLAKDNFRQGLNCAESVYLALHEAGLIDFPPETVALTTAFGGGLGLTGGMCGALVAATMGVSSVHGRRNPREGTQQEIIDKLYGNPGLYRFFNQIPHKFKEEYGSTQCNDLNQNFPDWFDKDRFRRCMKIVIESAAMAVEFIYQGNKEGYTQPFGKNMASKE